MSPQPVRYVFVYGTLRRGEERDINRLAPAPRWVGHASVAGTLHHLGAYPGLVLGGQDLVRGEVYEISPELERQLDEIEEVWPQQSGEYIRREVPVALDHPPAQQPAQQPASPQQEVPGTVICLLYEIAPGHARGKSVIVGGDWTLYRAGRSR
jgi:gamma-glutamylcyclotransferase (GGCT)/AIG2-like uncharacterized protein YtfP